MLVEDNPEYRKVIALALKKAGDMELVGEFGTAEIALRSLQTANDLEAPQLILLDLRLPGMNGLEALPLFKKQLPEIQIVILTQSDMESDVMKAISLGAAGYLLKSSSAQQIIAGIRSTLEGGAALDSGVTRQIMDSLRMKLPDEDPEGILSQREVEILFLLSEGLVKKEIAEKLKIHYKTVDSHVAHIYQKLEVSNAPSAISAGYRRGILEVKKDA